jgi:hypothetical protein
MLWNRHFVLWPNGNKTILKLEGSVIRAETLANGISWNATFQKEK